MEELAQVLAELGIEGDEAAAVSAGACVWRTIHVLSAWRAL